MKRFALIAGLMLWLPALVQSQSFEPKDTLDLAQLTRPVFEWMDFNNDGLLDMLITGQDLTVTDSSRSLTYIYQQNPDTTFTLQNTDLETYGTHQLRIADIDMDGRQDLVLAAFDGVRFEHAIYENNGDLTWNKVLITEGEALWQELRLADLNNDGVLEILTATNDSISIYQNGPTGWTAIGLPNEVPDILTDPVVFDYDEDGFLDVFLAGLTAEGDSVAIMMINEQEFEWNVYSVESDSLQIADYVVSDFNDDGSPDVLSSRVTDIRSRTNSLLINQDGSRLLDSLDLARAPLKNARVFAADLTSDGIVETDIEGQTPGVNNTGIISRERVIRQPTEIIYERDTLENTSGQGRRYGDLDFDGDLDYFEVTVADTGSRIWLFENTEETLNLGPDGLEDLLGFRFEETLYIVWNSANDDHTDPRSVTYDVTLGTTETSADILASGVDPVGRKRTVVGPGNNGYNPFLILNDAPTGEMFASVLPIDNAFHYNGPGAGGLGVGIGGPCDEELVVEEVLLCNETFVTLQTETGEVARWFSQAGGYLATASSLPLTVTGDDFVIAVYDRVGGCIDGEVFEIKYDPGFSDLTDLFACGGDLVEVTVDGNYSTIEWTSAESGTVLSTSNTLSYMPETDEQINVIATTARGCTFQESFQVDVDFVLATVQDTLLRIEEGGSVQLQASGGTNYVWVPPDGLSNSQIANPLASPIETTEYTVFVVNDNGCADEQIVVVEVVQSAFAPDAFSPNRDGRNETYRVYDLDGQVAEFEFIIYDRAGNKVFETSVVNEIAGRGWDGTNNGNLMPNGTYFWRVRGSYADGQEIKINGKNKGALQLIR